MTQILFLSFPALITFAGSYDLFSRTIGNWLCIAIALAFLPAAAMAGIGAAEIALHLSCGLAMLCAGVALFTMGWIGGGDAKLFAAAAIWFGWTHIADYAVISALAGGVLALGVLLSRSAATYMPRLAGLAPQRPELPYMAWPSHLARLPPTRKAPGRPCSSNEKGGPRAAFASSLVGDQAL